MALGLVDVKHDGTKGIVTLQSDNPNGALAIAELQHGAARNRAIEEAAKAGLPDPRSDLGAGNMYAVDANGAVVGDPRMQKVAAYRIDIPVTRRLV